MSLEEVAESDPEDAGAAVVIWGAAASFVVSGAAVVTGLGDDDGAAAEVVSAFSVVEDSLGVGLGEGDVAERRLVANRLLLTGAKM